MFESDVRGTIEALLLSLDGRFKMKTVLRQLRLSRTAILKHVRRMVDSGELVRQGAGPGTHYVRGPGWSGEPSGIVRTPERNGFWAGLMAWAPRAAYVELFAVLGATATRRTQARRALDGLTGREYIVVDFRRVERVTEQFVQELLCDWTWEMAEMGSTQIEPINVHPLLQPIVERVLRLRDVRRGHDGVMWGRGSTRD
jgi:hypothetical protein